MTMRTRTVAMLGGAMLWAGVAAAQGVDPLMGNFEGEVTGGRWEGEPVMAQIIGRPGDEYEARVTFGDGPDAMDTVLWGYARGGTAVFIGMLGEGDEAVPVTGESAAGEFTGRVRGRDALHPFTMEKVMTTPPTLGAEPPAGATLLLGTDGDMSKWRRMPEMWPLGGEGGVVVVPSQMLTKDEWGDATYHIEFRSPYMPWAAGQARGNSGCYFMGRYEVQILDSFGNPPADNEAGGIYQRAVPQVNACLPPMEWQTYDVDFTAPRFDADGNKTANARITVRYNGVVIHDDVELEGTTAGSISGEEEAPTGPLLLQNHNDQVQFRNIWVLPR